MILRRTALLVGMAAIAASAGCYAGYVDDYGYGYGYGYPTADVYIGGAYYPRYYGHYYRHAPAYGYYRHGGYYGRGYYGRPYAGGYGYPHHR